MFKLINIHGELTMGQALGQVMRIKQRAGHSFCPQEVTVLN